MTVSIVIPTHNRADLIGRAIRSVLKQSIMDLQIVVVDDGSTDDTPAIVKALATDDRILFARQSNRGRSEARNLGFSLSTGEFIGFLDSDDELLPDAIASHLATFAAQPDAGMTVAGYHTDFGSFRLYDDYLPWDWEEHSGLQDWLFNCFGMPGTVLHRRTWIERIGGFDPACEIAEDWDLYLRLAAAGCRTAWNRSIVCVYHKHAGNSVLDIERHYLGTVQALAKLSRSAIGLPLDLLTQARAWNEVVFTKRFIDAGQPERATTGLRLAIQLNPALIRDTRASVIEFILSSFGPPIPNAHQVEYEQILKEVLGATRRELNRARSRGHMSRFFRRAHGDVGRASLTSLQRGLRADPRWLTNRGVLSFILEYVGSRVRSSLSNKR
ncbi:MAG: glycosyltransferase family 2 protein [Ardenticatenia bacterium]|nr:glycosyltransferase family 2 protein [Ardenticatenia bacterium]